MKIKKRVLCILLSLALVVGLMPGMNLTAYAATSVTYQEASWDGSKVVYTEKTVDATPVTSSTTTLSSGWYVVDSTFTNSNRITISGAVNLILCDGKTMTASNGIYLQYNNSLSIYGQSNNTGKLVAQATTDQYAGIGPNECVGAGDFIMHGGTVETRGAGHGCGIGGNGGSPGSSGGNVTVYGGNLTAVGSYAGAGIGGNSSGGQGGSVIIYGGTVYAQGIGKSWSEEYGTPPYNSTIYFAYAAAGIGGGSEGAGGTVEIYGGTVTAIGGGTQNKQGQTGTAYGIGSGWANGDNGSLTISSGATITTGNSEGDASVKYQSFEGGTFEDDRAPYMKVEYLHAHHWTYSADADTITATCDGDGTCPIETKTLTLSANNTAYDGNAKDATINNGWTSNDDLTAPGDIYYEGTGDTEYAKSTTAPTNVGTYKASVTVDSVTAEKNFTIEKKNLTATADNKTVIYGDDVPEYTIAYTGFATGESASNAAGFSAPQISCDYEQYANTGSYPISLSGGTADNYSFTLNQGTLTVDPKSVTPTLTGTVSKTYDGTTGADKSGLGIELSGVVNNDDVGASIGTASFDNTNVGTGKTVTATGIALTGAKSGNYSLSTGTDGANVGEITARAVAVKAKDQIQELNGSVSSTADDVEVTEGSLASGQHIASAILTGDTSSVGAATVSLDAVTIEDSSSNDVTANYDITKENGTLTVTKVAPSHTPPTVNTPTYNGQEQELVTAGITGDGTIYYALLNSESAEPDSNTQWSVDVPKGEAAKTYYVWWKLTGDNDHRDIEPAKLEPKINKMALTVSASDQTITYGESISQTESDYTADTPVNGETLTVTLTADYEHDKIKPQAVIKKNSEDKTGNYDLTLNDGTLTVNPATLTVTPDSDQTKVYGDDDPTLTYTATGFVNGDNVNVITGTLGRAAGDNAGEYEIQPGDLSAPHYNITVTPGVKFEITKRSITGATVELNPSEDREYDEGSKSVTVDNVTLTVGNVTKVLTSGADYEVSGDLSGTDAGIYTVTVTGKGNYKDAAAAKWRITPAKPLITVSPNASAITYGQTLADSTLTGGEAEFKSAAVSGSFAWKDPAIKPSVSDNDLTLYDVIFTPEGSSNFGPAECRVTLSVNKADPKVTAPVARVLTWNGAEQELVSAGSTDGGTMQYALSENAAAAPEAGWSEDIPKADAAGTYYVWYRVAGDANHNDSEPEAVEVTMREVEITGIALRAINGTTMIPGASQQIEAKVTPNNANPGSLTWTSSDEKVAAVDENGRVTVKAENEIAWGDASSAEVDITASANKASAKITLTIVKQTVKAASVTIDPLSLKKDAKPGDVFRLTAIVEPLDATDRTVTWESFNTKVAEIGPTGIVKVNGYGWTTFTVRTANGKEDSIWMQVKEVPLSSISVNMADEDNFLVIGKTIKLPVSLNPGNTTDTQLIWKSSDEDVAVVDEDGNVTGTGRGRVTITVTSKSDESKTAAIDFIVFDRDDSLYVEFRDDTDHYYTGKAIMPPVDVYYHGKQLMNGTDYTVTYKNNINANTATNTDKAPKVVVKGKTVAAKAEAAFPILPVDIGDESRVMPQDVNITAGKKAAPVLYYGGMKLTDKDYSNPYAKIKFSESRPITVYGIGNFTGKREIWINVKNSDEIKNLPKISVRSFDPAKRYFNGQEHYISDREITVVSANDVNKVLEMDKDFVIAYPEDHTSAGTVKIAVVGIGDYTGSQTRSFRIAPAEINRSIIKSISTAFEDPEGQKTIYGKTYDTFTYAPGGVMPSVSVNITYKNGEEVKLSAGTDYSVTYKNNKKAGPANDDKPATATITFKGNFKYLEKQTKEFYITQADLSDAVICARDMVVAMPTAKYPLSVPTVDLEDVKVNKKEYTVIYRTDGDIIEKGMKLPGTLSPGESVTMDVEITANDENYTGTAPLCSYRITLADPSQDLSKAKVLIRRKGDESCKKVTKLKFTGKPVVIGEDDLEDYEVYVYTGKKARDPDSVLREGIDYTLHYSNNLKAGKATIVINAMEDSRTYFGSRTFRFNIVKGRMRWVR